MSSPLKIGFLGCGQMATALARGFRQANLVSPEDLIASDPQGPARAQFTEQTGARTVETNVDVVKASTVVILAVKPNMVETVLAEVGSQLTEEHLVISVAAGVSLARLASVLPGGARLVRVMPNTPALVGAAASAYAPGETATPEDNALVDRLFASVGLVHAVPEKLLDAVTGLSGSGPAFVCLILEAMSDGGVAEGLPRPVALQLAAQTLLGTAKMVLETGQHPAVLRDQVTSPGGTTIEGLHQLEEGGVRGAVIEAVRAAAERSRELGYD